MSSADPGIDVGQLSADQQAALQQYTDVTGQDVKNAIPLLQRSQWNVQVRQEACLLQPELTSPRSR